MTILKGSPFAPVEWQADLLKSHVTRGTARGNKTEGPRTLQMAVPEGWTRDAKCIGAFALFDETVGLKAGEAAVRCEGCPVIEQCLSAAMAEEAGLSAGSRYAVRGGLSPKERAALELAGCVCDRGHSRWGSHPGTSRPVCLDCKAEDARARWVEVGPARSIQRVSCVGCKAEMRTMNFGRHLNRCRRQEAA